MKKNVIAIDLGATSGRVILAAYDGDKVTMETLHRFPTPLIQKEGKYYWDIFNLRDNIVEGLGKAKGQKIESIGIDTWGVDFCIVDKDGNISMPRAYRDPYTDGIPEKFFEEMPREQLYNRTGIQIMNFNSVFQLYAQKKAGDLDKADKILFVPDALSYMLTGKMVCEYTILSTSALMDPRTKEFDPQILSILGLERSKFPQIVMPGHIVGTLKPEIGLGDVPVMAVAGHDTASAVAAVPAADEHFAYLSSGTWSLMGIETPDPVIDEKMFQMNYTNEGGAKGNTRLLKNITGLWIIEQCLKKWRSEGTDYNYAQVEKLGWEAASPEGLFDSDDPVFAAPSDMPAVIAKYCADHGFKAPANHGETIRMIYESLAAKYAAVLGKLRELAPFSIDTLHIIGGGSQNKLLSTLTAKACGIKTICGPGEGTALGNIMIQLNLSRPQILNSIETKTYLPE